MKKKISLILALITASVLIGCGEVKATNDLLDNNANANIETPSEPIEEVVADEKTPVEDSTIPEKKTEEIAAEVEEEKPVFEGLTEEWALEKLDLAKTAYKELTDHMDKPAESNALYCFFTSNVKPMDLKTKDGIILAVDSEDDLTTSCETYIGMCTYYFSNFVNNGGEYFDFADYISSHNLDEIVNYCVYDTSQKHDIENDYMGGMVYCESIYGTLSVKNIKNDNFEKSEILMPNDEIAQIAYQCDVFMEDKDTGLKMWFDKDGNLLGMGGSNIQIEVIIPFE